MQWHLVCRYQWCREARMQAHPQKFWCGENPGKIPENRQIRRNLSKICENLGKTPENLGKLTENTAKMASNMLCFLKNWPPMSAESHENFILFRKRSSWEKFAQKVVQNFFGQVWGNSDKNPVTAPKIFLLLHQWFPTGRHSRAALFKLFYLTAHWYILNLAAAHILAKLRWKVKTQSNATQAKKICSIRFCQTIKLSRHTSASSAAHTGFFNISAKIHFQTSSNL